MSIAEVTLLLSSLWWEVLKTKPNEGPGPWGLGFLAKKPHRSLPRLWSRGSEQRAPGPPQGQFRLVWHSGGGLWCTAEAAAPGMGALESYAPSTGRRSLWDALVLDREVGLVWAAAEGGRGTCCWAMLCWALGLSSCFCFVGWKD